MDHFPYQPTSHPLSISPHPTFQLQAPQPDYSQGTESHPQHPQPNIQTPIPPNLNPNYTNILDLVHPYPNHTLGKAGQGRVLTIKISKKNSLSKN